jgi:hypothetical protein
MIPFAIQNLSDIVPKYIQAHSRDNPGKRFCPFCGKQIDLKEYVTSFRQLDDGSCEVINLCRNCRDSGK